MRAEISQSGPDAEAGVEEEAEVGQLDQDDEALLVEELRGAEVGPGLGGSLRAEVAVVLPHLRERRLSRLFFMIIDPFSFSY